MTRPGLSQIDLARLRDAVAGLTQLRRDVYLLTARDGLDYVEVSARLGISVAEVERTLAEALVDIVRALDREDPEPFPARLGFGGAVGRVARRQHVSRDRGRRRFGSDRRLGTCHLEGLLSEKF
jgi:hypothetical protein